MPNLLEELVTNLLVILLDLDIMLFATMQF
jgi:hypothetical protein